MVTIVTLLLIVNYSYIIFYGDFMKTTIDTAQKHLEDAARLTFYQMKKVIKNDIDEVIDGMGDEYVRQIGRRLAAVSGAESSRWRHYSVEPHVLWIYSGGVFVVGLLAGYMLG